MSDKSKTGKPRIRTLALYLGIVQELLGGLRVFIPDEIFTEVEEVLMDSVIHGEVASIHDPHVHPKLRERQRKMRLPSDTLDHVCKFLLSRAGRTQSGHRLSQLLGSATAASTHHGQHAHERSRLCSKTTIHGNRQRARAGVQVCWFHGNRCLTVPGLHGRGRPRALLLEWHPFLGRRRTSWKDHHLFWLQAMFPGKN